MNTSKVMGALLSLMLGSCATVQPSPSHGEELLRLVLFIEERSDGTLTQSWRNAEEADLSRFALASEASRHPGHIVPAMGGTRDCDAENRACVGECMSRPLPRGFGHITSGGRGLGGKEGYCNEKCMQPYRDCLKVQALQPQEFTAVDAAMDWLRNHRGSVLVGSVVIIAGVAFVVVSAGAGALILAPAVLLSGPSPRTEPFLVEALP